MTALLQLETEQKRDPIADEMAHYARDRQRYSLTEMKRLLPRGRAIELERQYHGIEELLELQKLALIQANRICVALGKPELIAWPKGWFDVKQGDCDSCGQKGYLRSMFVGVTFPAEGDFCHRCRDEEIDETEYRLTTPLEVACDFLFRVEDCEDFWILRTSNEDAITVAQSHPSFDVYELSSHSVLTAREATYRQDSQLALVLPENLSLFLTHFVEGLFPSLVEG
ncbi:MAG: hypothetical protein AABN95_16215 [Acidobacteriota bacterium]